MKTLKQRFEEKIYYGLDGCWYWTGAITKVGYGRFSVSGVNCLASRVSYELYKNNVFDGFFVCHHCDNPSCVNPDHLFLGTAQDNIDDQIKKGRLPGLKSFGILHTINGITKSHKEWCKIYNIKFITAYNRIYRAKWPIEKAFCLPPRKFTFKNKLL